MLNAAQKLDRIFLPGELADVAPHLMEPALRRALDWVTGLDAEAGTGVVRVLLPRLADLGHVQEAYDRALAGQEVGRDANNVPGAEAWANLIPLLPEPLRSQACREALRLATSIDDRGERLRACVSQRARSGTRLWGTYCGRWRR
jgi:hypothetical protein